MTDFMIACRHAALAAVGATAVAVAACRGTPAPVSTSAPVAAPAPTTAASNDVVRRPLSSYPLAPLDGSRLTVTVVEVTYKPGEKSKAHSHPCAVIGYIVEGTYRTQVKGEAEHVYSSGETFYEPANGVHVVSANASDERPVRFLAYFTCDRQTPLTVPPLDSAGSRPE
jgi:quercetin dioxygenase-like cupin family protein